PGGVAALERADAGGDECAVSFSIAGCSLLVGRTGNVRDGRGEESCLLSRIADQQGRDENAVALVHEIVPQFLAKIVDVRCQLPLYLFFHEFGLVPEQ
ncbi:MAG: hypothetical protein ACK6EB_42160, partial [Planctomyces sp.]